MKIGFDVKWGHNELEIPVTDNLKPKFQPYQTTDKFTEKVTIYNDIPADGVNLRRFDRFVIDKCNIQGGIVSKADGTIENIVNAVTVITRETDLYTAPAEYRRLPADMADSVYTVQIGDFVVLGEVDDVVTTSREFAELQTKYASNGFVVRTVSTYIEGMAVDNVQFANVG